MKKRILVTAAVMGFLFYTMNVSAQTKPATEKNVVKTEQTTKTPGKFVDKDKNGLCDKHEGKGVKCNTNVNCKGPGKGNGNQCGQGKAKENCNGSQKRDGSCNQKK